MGGLDVAGLAKKTVDTVRDVAKELPHAKTPREALEVLTGGERQIYVGVALAAAALLLLLFVS